MNLVLILGGFRLNNSWKLGGFRLQYIYWWDAESHSDEGASRSTDGLNDDPFWYCND